MWDKCDVIHTIFVHVKMAIIFISVPYIQRCESSEPNAERERDGGERDDGRKYCLEYHADLELGHSEISLTIFSTAIVKCMFINR